MSLLETVMGIRKGAARGGLFSCHENHLKQGAIMADTGAYLFLAVLFVVLFGLPAWLMFRHRKKSKAKLARLRKEQPKLSPDEVKKQWHKGHKRALRVIAAGGGAFLGVKLFGFIGGVVLASMFGLLASVIADLIWGNSKDDPFSDSQL